MTLDLPLRPLATALLLAAVGTFAACTDAEVLGPPDGVACTRGTIAAGDTVEDTIDDESCLVYSHTHYWGARAQSWTLKAKPNTAYVIRLQPVAPDDAEPDEFYGLLSAFTRAANGDAQFATRDLYEFREDERGREMFLVSDRAQDISLRVEVLDFYGGFGEYRLEVESCPVTILKPSEEIEDLAVGDGCLSEGFDSRHRSRVRFVAFRAHPDSAYEVAVERTAGQSALVGALMGPDLDLAESTDFSLHIRTVNDLPAFGIESYIQRAGLYTLAIGIPSDGAATVRAALDAGLAAFVGSSMETK